MGATEVARFEEGVVRALAAVGAAPDAVLLDPVIDPEAVIAALAEPGEGTIALRAGAALGPGEGAGYAPAPRSPVWVGVERGAAEVRIAPLELAAGAEASARSIAAVRIEEDRVPCCDDPACSAEKTRARAWLALAPAEGSLDRLLVAEATSLAPAEARAVVTAVAAALARVTGAPLEPRREPPSRSLEPRRDPPSRSLEPKRDPPSGSLEPGPASLEAAAAAEPGTAPAPAKALPRVPASRSARFAMQSEGDRVVLRDHASAGPRASAARNTMVAVVLGAIAAGLWAMLWREASERGASNVALMLGASAAVLSLAAYAFLGVARFARRYAATSAPLVAIAPGRFVTMPWVSRAGAVDLRPEGRFGAAVPIGELHGVSVSERGGGFGVEIDTDHGAFDALVGERDVAELWAEVLRRALAAAAHPDAKASARQRARARARSSPAKSPA